MKTIPDQPVVLFDGVCNFCSGTVRFIIKPDRRQRFRFAPLQSQLGVQITTEYGYQPLDSMLLLHEGQIYQKSNAALRILKLLGGIWSVAYVFIIIPTPIRDLVYDFIGQHRYRWFGKKEQCWLPDEEIKNRFLD